jgi:uncharacterized protein YbjT (DUF2867 family)
MRSFFSEHCRGLRLSWVAALSLLLAGCAKAAITPESIVPPDPSLAYNAIEAERAVPAQVYVLDFSFVSSAVTENTSPLHRAIDLARSTQPPRTAGCNWTTGRGNSFWGGRQAVGQNRAA